MKAEAIVEIINKKGLHARAAAKFVKIVASYQTKIGVVKKSQNGEADSISVDGNSILGLMMLGAETNSFLHIQAEGEQAEKLVHELRELVAERFGEKE